MKYKKGCGKYYHIQKDCGKGGCIWKCGHEYSLCLECQSKSNQSPQSIAETPNGRKQNGDTFCLKDKIREWMGYEEKMIDLEDVKEFIKIILEELCPEFNKDEMDYESSWDRIPQSKIWMVVTNRTGDLG